MLVTLLHGMQRDKADKGLATLCIGGDPLLDLFPFKGLLLDGHS